MKKLKTLLTFMLVTIAMMVTPTSVAFAQDSTAQDTVTVDPGNPGTPSTDPIDLGALLASFALVVVAMPFVIEAINAGLKINAKGTGAQLLSWGLCLVVALFSKWVGVGFFAGMSYPITLMWGFGVALAVNGHFKTPWIQAILGAMSDRLAKK